MDSFPQFSRLSLVKQFDFFQSECDYFERDVHLLILGTLHAATTYLSGELTGDVAKIKSALEKAGGEYHEYLIDQYAELKTYCTDQQRFVRNMAVVALASRLTHALRQMAKSAETFSPRRKRYGKGDMSEFQRLWAEYSERFGINLNDHADLIAFIEPMRVVRNQIVHDGGQANPFKSLDDSVPDRDFNDMLDISFSLKYPEFVDGEGSSAEVSVREDQLQAMINNSVALVKWCAHELRIREHASAIKDDDANPGRMKFGLSSEK
jgi:hypothetical protein